ncbi:hypothetical protein H5410_064170 [Solanum commersonii]|uniref:PDZ domain-containing protein n=1 Tax=Solanum commersonii TaxID=4109 RepID=A0A9J5W0B7_SOLCO|nr:hypothetical protein H5410_064170 [Solanum commersonii]
MKCNVIKFLGRPKKLIGECTVRREIRSSQNILWGSALKSMIPNPDSSVRSKVQVGQLMALLLIAVSVAIDIGTCYVKVDGNGCIFGPDVCTVKVLPGSSAESAGIKHNDVIIQFGGKRIQSFLELFETMWNNVGESVELVVIRTSHDVPAHLSMVVEEVTSDKLYSWPHWELATLGGMMAFEDSNILRVADNGKMYGGSNMQCELS